MVSKFTIIPIIQVHFSNSEGGFGADSGPADQNGLSGESGSIPEDTHFLLDIHSDLKCVYVHSAKFNKKPGFDSKLAFLSISAKSKLEVSYQFLSLSGC